MSFSGQQEHPIFFYKEREKNGYLSNFFTLKEKPVLFVDPLSRLRFISSEQCYMVAKAAIADDLTAFVELMLMDGQMDIKTRAERINLPPKW